MRGIDSHMLVRYRGSSDASVLSISDDISAKDAEEMLGCEMINHYYIEQNRSDMSNSSFTFPYPGYNLASHSLVLDADAINLHCTDSFQSPATVRKLLDLGKPLIWTLSDQNPFTGGCHYASGCKGYESECFPCLQLLHDPCRLPAEILKEKMSFLANTYLTIVSPSNWLAECARRSVVFGSHRIEVIPNGVNLEVFKNQNKIEAKKSFGLDSNDIVVVVTADSGRETRKGFHIIREIITKCLKNLSFCRLFKEGRLHLFALGSHMEKIDHMGFPVRKFGHVDDNRQLSLIYSAADILLYPSMEDSFPICVIEAMSCGTPAIAFEVGGLKEIISDTVDGYLIPAFDVGLMANRFINSLINHQDLLPELSANARKKVQRTFSLDAMAESYEKLLSDVIHNKSYFIMPVRNNHFISFSESSPLTSILGMSSQLKQAVESAIFLINKSLLANLRKVQVELSTHQKQLSEALSENTDLQRQVLSLQHQVNCLSSARGAIKALFERFAEKYFVSKKQDSEKKRDDKIITSQAAENMQNKVESDLFNAIAIVRAMPGHVDEKTLVGLFVLGKYFKKILCIEPSLDMVQAACVMSNAGVDVLCIGDNYELLYANKAKLQVYHGDPAELLHHSDRLSLTDYDCILVKMKDVAHIAWLLADSAHFSAWILLYHSETTSRYTLSQYTTEQTIGDFSVLRSKCIF